MKLKLIKALKTAAVAFFGALGGAAFVPELLHEVLKYIPLPF
jgi:hypothetical protein